MKNFFHPVPSMVVRIVLGGIMIYASYHKIADPGDFAKVLFNYKIFPAASINLLAIYVPWIEVLCGAALIVGVGRKGAALLAIGFFVSFILLLGYNLARECPTICGCFGTYAEGKSLSVDEKFADMRKEIWLVDVPCLVASLYVFLAAFLNERPRVDDS